MKTRPQDVLISTLVGVDDSFGRCVATCVDSKGARARSLGQPRLVIQSDCEHSIFELVRQTCDELPRARQQVTPTASKGSNARVEEANKAVEGMTRTIMSCVATRYEVEVPTGHPVGQHAAWLLDRFQPGEDGLTRYHRQHQRNCQRVFLPFTENVLWHDPGPHSLKLRSKWSHGV